MRRVALALAVFALGCGGRKLNPGRDGAAGGGGAAPNDGGHDAPASSRDADGDGVADALEAPASDAGASCELGGSPARACHPEFNQRCGHVCGQACADFALDPANCGACGIACGAEAVCVGGACQATPTVVVPAAPGCLSIDIVHENGQLTWADFGHGAIKRVATSGGAATTLASNINLAGIHAGPSNNGDTSSTVTPILVRDGTVYFIAADEPAHTVMRQGQLCHVSDDGGETCTPDGPFFPVLVGAAGATIQAVTPGSAPRTLLSAALAPATWTTTLSYTDHLSGKPPIAAIALSPDGKVLYFAAGGSLYSLPSAGAASSADVTRLGPTRGQLSVATALVTDGRRLVFPSPFDDDWVHYYDLAAPCDASTASDLRCPGWVGASHVNVLVDTILVRDGWLYWGNGTNLRRADLSQLAQGIDHPNIAQTANFELLSGFDVGPRYTYFGEAGQSDGWIERAPLDHADASVYDDTFVLARGQKTPRSVVFDGARIYWTTDDCDIKTIADPPP